MGLISSLVAYKVGKRRGRRKAERVAEREELADFHDDIDREDCVNYYVFCKNFGSCDGQVCERA